VIVTGATGGIGREIVLGFDAAGARVAAVDLKQEAVDALVAELTPGRHLAIGAGLRDVSGHEALTARAVRALGRLDALPRTAAVLVRRNNVDDVTEADWDIQHDVNLKSTFFLNQAAGRVMRAAGRGGRIINFTSQGFWSGGFGGSVAYAASKGGIVSMTRG